MATTQTIPTTTTTAPPIINLIPSRSDSDTSTLSLPGHGQLEWDESCVNRIKSAVKKTTTTTTSSSSSSSSSPSLSSHLTSTTNSTPSTPTTNLSTFTSFNSNLSGFSSSQTSVLSASPSFCESSKHASNSPSPSSSPSPSPTQTTPNSPTFPHRSISSSDSDSDPATSTHKHNKKTDTKFSASTPSTTLTASHRTISSSSIREKLSSISSISTLALSSTVSTMAVPIRDNIRQRGRDIRRRGRKVIEGTKIEFAPASIPRTRRLQTMAVALWELLMPLTSFCFLMLCSIPQLWPFIGVYLIWIFWIDTSPEHGGRSSERMRSLPVWKYFAEYYPASMIKEQDLPADRPYVFGYHPHGIISMGALATFATSATGFSKQFPDLSPHLLTLASNFHVPIYRDILLSLGVCSVSKRSCVNILRRGKGSSICIVIGGAAESLSARPGTADLTLRRRLGFIKVAMQEGADLVPVFSFGENDIFSQMPNQKGTTIYELQKKFQSMFGFTLPLFHGRGLLNYNIGLMPYRRPIVSVVGRPINVEKREKPTAEEVKQVQEAYIRELYRIWETYKDVFATNRLREMSIVD